MGTQPGTIPAAARAMAWANDADGESTSSLLGLVMQKATGSRLRSANAGDGMKGRCTEFDANRKGHCRFQTVRRLEARREITVRFHSQKVGKQRRAIRQVAVAYRMRELALAGLRWKLDPKNDLVPMALAEAGRRGDLGLLKILDARQRGEAEAVAMRFQTIFVAMLDRVAGRGHRHPNRQYSA